MGRFVAYYSVINASIEASYAVDPLLSNPGPLNDTGPAIQQAPPADSSDNDEGKEDRLMWTEEMLEQLVEVLYQVFDEGGAADNSFKKPPLRGPQGRFAEFIKVLRRSLKSNVRINGPTPKENGHTGCF